ncbi:MAG TPA: hypothetical protein VM778_00895, partial [Gemmatimonadota bacterium]|nr:hypothetical protein [Gemmatimonadota bacterium]
ASNVQVTYSLVRKDGVPWGPHQKSVGPVPAGGELTADTYWWSKFPGLSGEALSAQPAPASATMTVDIVTELNKSDNSCSYR